MEMGFIQDHTDIMRMENRLLKFVMDALKESCGKEFEFLKATVPEVPENISAMKLREAQEIIKKKTKKNFVKKTKFYIQAGLFV